MSASTASDQRDSPTQAVASARATVTSSGAAFEAAAHDYVHFYLQHMSEEERLVLPLAQQALTPTDWVELDEAFAENRDPLTGCAPTQEYEALFSRIVNRVPAPLGLGDPIVPSRH